MRCGCAPIAAPRSCRRAATPAWSAAPPVAEDGSEIILSLSRMNRVRAIDPVDLTMEIEAGVPLKSAQQGAAEAGCLLPLSISSEGSAQIGGVLATNAGGNNTVRYGNARDLVLGLEVVLPDGQVWNGLRRLHKDNTGYCLRQLFVGSEGTLGIITAAVLKLYPRPREAAVALCAVASPEAALHVFNRFQQNDAAAISAYEYMSGLGMSFVLKHIPGATLPLSGPAAHYALVELATPRPGADLRGALEGVLAGVWRRGSSSMRRSPRAARNGPRCGGCARSIPRRRSAPALRSRTTCRCRFKSAGADPPRRRGLRAAGAGSASSLRPPRRRQHPLQPRAAGRRRRRRVSGPRPRVMDAVNAVVRDLDGSFSAEHGIGG